MTIKSFVIKYIPEILLVIFMLSSIFFVVDISKLRPTNDGYQYMAIAQSILHGEYSWRNDEPTMLREPGYPLFLAGILLFKGNYLAILLIQTALAVVTSLLWRKNWMALDPKLEFLGAWGTTLSYGYWSMARMFYSEVFTGFLLAVAIYSFAKFLKKCNLTSAVLAGLAFSALTLTRATFILLGAAFALYFLWYFRRTMRKILPKVFIFCFCFTLLPLGWMYRNYQTFGQFSIATRLGGIMTIQATKVSMGWVEWRDSLISTLVGTRTLQIFKPEAEPWSSAHNHLANARVHAIFPNLDNLTESVSDSLQLKEAKRYIFENPEHALRYFAWFVVSGLKFTELPSPVYYPEMGVEKLFFQDPLTPVKALALFFIQLIQTGYRLGLLLGLIALFRIYRRDFFLALPIIYLALIQLPLDTLPRFIAPLQPLLFGVALFAVLHFLQRHPPTSLHCASARGGLSQDDKQV